MTLVLDKPATEGLEKLLRRITATPGDAKAEWIERAKSFARPKKT